MRQNRKPSTRTRSRCLARGRSSLRPWRIMLEQLVLIFNKDDIARRKVYKLQRLRGMLEDYRGCGDESV